MSAGYILIGVHLHHVEWAVLCIDISGLLCMIHNYLLFYHVFIVGIGESDQMAIYQILAAILHLSNVEVKDQTADRSSILVNTDYPRTQQESILCRIFGSFYVWMLY